MLNKLFASSANPQELGMTVRASLLAVVPVVLGLAKILGVEALDDTSLKVFIEAVVNVVISATALISALGVLFGIARKVYFFVKNFNKPS